MDAPAPAPDEERLKVLTSFATDALSHVRDTITLADQKAGFLFGTVTAILAYLHTTGASQKLIQAVRAGQAGFGELLLGVAVLGLVAAAVGALLVVVPRGAAVAQKGIVASWAIAAFDAPPDYADAVFASDPAALARAKLEYGWVLAQISRRKYRYINAALRAGFVGLVTAIVYLAVG